MKHAHVQHCKHIAWHAEVHIFTRIAATQLSHTAENGTHGRGRATVAAAPAKPSLLLRNTETWLQSGKRWSCSSLQPVSSLRPIRPHRAALKPQVGARVATFQVQASNTRSTCLQADTGSVTLVYWRTDISDSIACASCALQAH